MKGWKVKHNSHNVGGSLLNAIEGENFEKKSNLIPSLHPLPSIRHKIVRYLFLFPLPSKSTNGKKPFRGLFVYYLLTWVWQFY